MHAAKTAGVHKFTIVAVRVLLAILTQATMVGRQIPRMACSKAAAMAVCAVLAVNALAQDWTPLTCGDI